MAYKTMSIRIDKDDYDFVKKLAAAEREDISGAVRELIDLGRIHFAIEQYKIKTQLIALKTSEFSTPAKAVPFIRKAAISIIYPIDLNRDTASDY